MRQIPSIFKNEQRISNIAGTATPISKKVNTIAMYPNTPLSNF